MIKIFDEQLRKEGIEGAIHYVTKENPAKWKIKKQFRNKMSAIVQLSTASLEKLKNNEKIILIEFKRCNYENFIPIRT